jgi:CheY-like chemotaxis protein
MPKPARILLVDDQAVIVELVSEVLSEDGHCICSCSSAEQAVDEIEGADDFDAVITDIDLGSSIDGFEIARRARAHRPDAAIIYISGGVSVRAHDKFVPGAAFIYKPFSPYQVADQLSALLGSHSG